MSKKDNIQNKIDVFKNALSTILITFFSLCGFTFIRLKEAGFLEFCVYILAAFGLMVSYALVFVYFNKYNNEIEKL